jgi:nuclear pore complex protein Nup160
MIYRAVQNRERTKISKYVPESKYVSSKHETEIIQLTDMEYECTLLQAQIDSIRRDPSLLSSSGEAGSVCNLLAN